MPPAIGLGWLSSSTPFGCVRREFNAMHRPAMMGPVPSLTCRRASSWLNPRCVPTYLVHRLAALCLLDSKVCLTECSALPIQSLHPKIAGIQTQESGNRKSLFSVGQQHFWTNEEEN